MTQEVDLKSDARVPLGETDEEFYKNIYTGQRGFILPPAPRLPPPSEFTEFKREVKLFEVTAMYEENDDVHSALNILTFILFNILSTEFIGQVQWQNIYRHC
jgi:hypothetical protein